MATQYRTSGGGRIRKTTSRGAPVSKGYDVQKQGTLAKGAAQAVAPTGIQPLRGGTPATGTTTTPTDASGAANLNEPGWGGTPTTEGEAGLTAVQPDAYATPTTPTTAAEQANPLVARNMGLDLNATGSQGSSLLTGNTPISIANPPSNYLSNTRGLQAGVQGTDAFGKPLTLAKATLQQGGADQFSDRFNPGQSSFSTPPGHIALASNPSWAPSLEHYQASLLRNSINPETIGNAVVQRNPLGQVTGMNVPGIGQIDQMYRDRAAVSAEHARQEHLAHLATRAREYANADVFQQRANQWIPQLGRSDERATRMFLDRIVGPQQSSLSAVNPALLTGAPAQFREVAPDSDLIRQQMLKATEDKEVARLKQKKPKAEEDQNQLEG